MSQELFRTAQAITSQSLTWTERSCWTRAVASPPTLQLTPTTSYPQSFSPTAIWYRSPSEISGVTHGEVGVSTGEQCHQVLSQKDFNVFWVVHSSNKDLQKLGNMHLLYNIEYRLKCTQQQNMDPIT